MATPAASEPIPDGEGAPTLKPRIDPLTRLLVLKLRDAEPSRSTNSIAAVAGISEASARRILSGHVSDVKALAKQLMQSTLMDRVENWEDACIVGAAKGDHRPTRDYLIAAEAIAEPSTTTLNLGFQVVVAPSPGTPTYPTLEAQVVTTPTTELLTTASTERGVLSEPTPVPVQAPLEPHTKRIRR